MPKLVKKITHDFTIISNKIFHDKNLKGIDRGILGTMLSLADGWNFSIKGLAKILPDGETAIANSLRRITEAHYLVRKRVYEKGKIVDWEYIISDEPMEFESNSDSDDESNDFFVPNLNDEKLDVENQDVENLNLEKPHDNKITKNKESKDKESSDKESINPSSASHKIEKTANNSIDEIDRLKSRREKRTAIELMVKHNIEYDWYEEFFADNPDNSLNKGEGTFAGSMAEIDMLVSIVVNTICSEKQYIRIGKEDLPHSVVESRFKKLEMKHIEYALKCLMLNTTDIKNPLAYLTTVLYNASITCDFTEANELKNLDPALFIPEQFHNEAFREKYYENTVFRPKSTMK